MRCALPLACLSPLGVASGETGQLNVALSGATEESALSEDGKGRGLLSTESDTKLRLYDGVAKKVQKIKFS